MRHLTLLGPQRDQPTVGAVLDELGVDGRVAVVTAGWQEREAEDEDLRVEIEGAGPRPGDRSMSRLALYARAEHVFGEHPDLFARLQEHHDRRQAAEEIYRRRLDHALAAARAALAWRGVPGLDAGADREIRSNEREHAIRAVTSLDVHHLRRVAELESTLLPDPRSYPTLARERDDVRRELTGSSALVLAGGHVVVLRNRLGLFGFRELLETYDRPVIAWSAAAMLLAETVALFHDRPPQGAGNAEVLAAGLGFAGGLIVLPDASRRLRLDVPGRVALFARRFPERVPLVFDVGARLDLVRGPEDGSDDVQWEGVRWDGGRWQRAEKLSRLTRDGTVEPVGEIDPRAVPARGEARGAP